MFADDRRRSNSGTDIVCCKKGMEPRSCVNDCNARTCVSLKMKPDPGQCSKECYANSCHCRSGLYLNECNECVSKDRCGETCKDTPVKCPGKNEELMPCFDPDFSPKCWNWLNHTSCTPNSPRDVNLYDTPDSNGRWPEGQCILNVCDCRPGYFRNICGICVQWHECGKSCEAKANQPCSDPHEKRYDEWRECEERTCVNLKYPMKRDAQTDRVVKNKCDCKSGYYRDNCGRCVPKPECDNQRPCKCTNPCKKRNQVLRCINSCTKQTCAKALDVPRICKKQCYDACDCNDNFWLNRHGKCVFRDECTSADVKATAKMLRDEDVKSEAEVIFDRPLPIQPDKESPWKFWTR